MSQLRNFEISIWTLQDDFITTIESAWIKTKGKTQNASMTLNIDGTQQLNFSIPMYYYKNGIKSSNPAWITFSNNKILLNTRKIKVILNKQTENEEIYEFVIDKVKERHEKDELYCDIECSGLAFYELGKIGYKVSLSEEDFYNDDYNWFIGKEDTQGNKIFTKEPVANIQYWLNKFLIPYPEDNDENILSNQWYYKIQMNWDLTASFSEFIKSTNKIYENDIYNDSGHFLSKEKYRMVNLKESNFYNLTQNIAEIFGVYCKYIYSYDENYHIIGRTIIFYNNFLYEVQLSINYRGNTQSISRELDTTDLVTKMHVKSIDNSGETISIIDVDENTNGEDYLLNFDYLYSIGNIDEESYNNIENYEASLKELNKKLKDISGLIINIENQLPSIRARASLAEDSIQLDKEKIAANNKLLNALTDSTGFIEINNLNPDTAVLLKEPDKNYYYIKLSKMGIDPSSIKIYKTLSSTSSQNTLTSQITTAIPIYDGSNNLIKMTNIYWDEVENRSKIVYLTYRYQPSLYYENIKKAWIQKLNKDSQEAEAASNELSYLEATLEQAYNNQETYLNQKQILIDEFEKTMGPAIREGYWQPEDYSEHMESFVSSYKINKLKTKGSSPYDLFLWDNKLFEGEQDISYKLGIEEVTSYYPCINLINIWNNIKDNLNTLSFSFYDTSDSAQYNSLTFRDLAFNSGAQIIFLLKDDLVFPALLLTGLENYSSDSIGYAYQNGKIGFTLYDANGNYHVEGGENNQGINVSNFWITLNNTYQIVYPRICINSMNLKTDTNSLILRDNQESLLTQYTDYYINSRVDEDEDSNSLVANYYITIKPQVIAKTEGLTNHIIEIMFKISNYAVSIYRDAKEILKENSKPKVSYNANIDIFNKQIIKSPSYYLNKIVKINDYELLLNNVRGYISEVILDLDHPENDSIAIQNYTNKFEDLFTTIVAQTEEMKKTNYIMDSISSSFSPDGSLTFNTLQKSIRKVDLNYAFNNGNLNIDEANGIWGISDTGVVAFRGGGIFTATERDSYNNWIWNTGITPEGINADLITTGQLDTNKIRIFAGDRERFQLNGTGLYAYKTFMSDFDIFYNIDNISYPSEMQEKIQEDDQVLDPAQFVRFDENGLFLIAKEGAYVLNEDKTEYKVITSTWTDINGNVHRCLDDNNELKRVSISWDGLTLRNLNGERIFYANANTGDLMIKGSVYADAFYVIKQQGNQEVSESIATFINETSLTELMTQLKNNNDVGARIKDYINVMSTSIGGRYIKTLNSAQQKFTSGENFPLSANIGDYFYNTYTKKSYLRVSDTGDNAVDWEDLNIYEADTASMIIDNIGGSIKLQSTKNITLTAVNSSTNNIESVFNISINGITLQSNKAITLNSQAKINVLSQGAIDIASGGFLSAVGSDFYIANVSKEAYNNSSTEEKKSLSYLHGYFNSTDNKYHLDIGSDNLRITSNGSLTLESGSTINIRASGAITLMSGVSSAIELSSAGISMDSNKTLKIDTNNFKLRPDLTFNTTNGNYNNIFFYVGDTFNSTNQNPSHYIKYSYLKGLQIKTTNFVLDPNATGTSTVWSIGDTSSNTNGYIQYTADGTLKVKGSIYIEGMNNPLSTSAITTITENAISTTNITANNLKVNAANILGNLTIRASGDKYVNYRSSNEYQYRDLTITLEGGPDEGAGLYYYIGNDKTFSIKYDSLAYTSPDEVDLINMGTITLKAENDYTNITIGNYDLSSFLIIRNEETWSFQIHSANNLNIAANGELRITSDTLMSLYTNILHIGASTISIDASYGRYTGYTGAGWLTHFDNASIANAATQTYMHFVNGLLVEVSSDKYTSGMIGN